MKKWTSDSGYSLLETMMTLAIFGTVAAMAAFQIGIARPGFKGDGAMRTVMAQMNTAREQAITERRVMRILFTAPNTVQIVRENFPVAQGLTIISTVTLEGGISYGLTTGVPDTPDGLGKATAIDFGTATLYRFTSEGTLVNQANQPISGTVFLALPGQNRGARAITIMGATGRVRGYKWNGGTVSRDWKRV
jgi:prepilin-type N-terminal cleavage/methylation domain-containing protein